MITVYGRPDSSAVARVMWTLGELGVSHERIDWGGAHGGNDTAEYRAMNPAGRIPTVRFEDGTSLWESNTIIRHLCRTRGGAHLLPIEPYTGAKVEAWMDWSQAFANAVSRLRKAYKPADATMDDVAKAQASIRPVLEILNTQLNGKDHVAGNTFSCADISLGVWAHRLWRCPPECRLADLPYLDAWIGRLQTRLAYQEHVMDKVSAGKQSLGGG